MDGNTDRLIESIANLRDNPVQRDFVFSPYKYTGYYGGVRNGKTWGGCWRGMMFSEMFPGNVGVVGRLTYNELKDTTQSDFLKFVRQRNGGTLEPGPYVKRYVESPAPTLTLYNDSEIRFRYLANIEAILSMTLGWFYIDQAEFVPEGTYNALESRLSLWNAQNIEKCRKRYYELHKKHLRHKPRDAGWITGNPAPGWVYQRYKLNPTGEYKLYEAPSEANIKNLPKDYLEGLKRTQTEAWIKRYLSGSWDTFAGQVYKEFSKSLHVIPPMAMKDHWPRFLALDHGQVDPTCLLCLAVDEDGNTIVYKEYYKSDPVMKNHADAMLSLIGDDIVPRTDDGKPIVWMDYSIKSDKDPVTGRNFMDLYLDYGIAGLNANKHLNAGIQKVQELLHPDPQHRFPKWHPRSGELGSPRLFIIGDRCPATLHEIILYEWEPVPEGKEVNSKEKPRDYLNHAMDTLRYAVNAIFEKAPQVKEKKDHVTYDEFVLAEITGENQRLKDKAGVWD